MKRGAGILLPITALPSNYGIGTMGKCAKDFVDYLKESKQSYWQILPLGPTSYGDSPYSAFSSFAGNPYLIDLELLMEDGLLEKKEITSQKWGAQKDDIDYGIIYNSRFVVLRKAVKRLFQKRNEDVESFIQKENSWLDDYALYMAIKNHLNDISIADWPKELKYKEPKAIKEIRKELKEDIQFYKGVQYLFFQQWDALKTYANENGIQIIGDLPIYVARDSADVWASPEQFQLDKKRNPKAVSGVPPDYFSADGQLWGNPLYDWKQIKKENYRWWKKRLKQQFRFYDVLRLDHFRGFESYYVVDAKAETAKNGKWKKGPDYDFFKNIQDVIEKKEIIAEDLGNLTPAVYELLDKTGYPGMKVLEFAFDPNDKSGKYLPHRYTENNVVYIGTHDNETLQQWFEEANPTHVRRAKEYFNIHEDDEANWKMIQGAYRSVAKLVIVQFQDILGLGKEARMNQPSTIGRNWRWRYDKKVFPKKYAKRLEKLVEMYQREE